LRASEAALFQPAHGELVAGNVGSGTIDQAVEVCMLDAQLDQPARQGMQVFVHRDARLCLGFCQFHQCQSDYSFSS